MSLIFFVPGQARPQGSKRTKFARDKWGNLMFDERNNPKTYTVDSANWKKGSLRHWKHMIAKCALVAIRENGFRRIPSHTGVAVQMRFIFPRPARGTVYVNYVKRPDLEKLERACIDAMAGIVYDRDEQVCSKVSEKDYQRPGDPGLGVVVAITERRK